MQNEEPSRDERAGQSSKSTLGRVIQQPDFNPPSMSRSSAADLESPAVEPTSTASSMSRKSSNASVWNLSKKILQMGSGESSPPPVPSLPAFAASNSSRGELEEDRRKSLSNAQQAQSTVIALAGPLVGNTKGVRQSFAERMAPRRRLQSDSENSARSVDSYSPSDSATPILSGKRGIIQRTNSGDQSPEQTHRRIVSFRPTVEEVFEASNMEQSTFATTSVISDEDDSSPSNSYPKESHPKRATAMPDTGVKPTASNIKVPNNDENAAQLDSNVTASIKSDSVAADGSQLSPRMSADPLPAPGLISEEEYMSSAARRRAQAQALSPTTTNANFLDAKVSKPQRRDSFALLTKQLSSLTARRNTDSVTSFESIADSYVPSKVPRTSRLGSFMGRAKEGHEYNRSESVIRLPPEHEPTEAEIEAEYQLQNRRQSTRDNAKIKLFDVEADARQSSIARPAKIDHSSQSSFTAGMGKWPHAREVSENFSRKLTEIRYIILSVVLNTCLIFFAHFSGAGIMLPLSPASVHMTLAVIIEIILLSTNILTTHALDFGVSIFLSMLMTNKSGYGMCACGFVQEHSIKRLKYAQSLSLNSTCRKTLERTSYLWLLLEVTKTLTPIAATAVIHSEIKALSDDVNCIVFEPTLSKMYDRTYPTIESSAGVAEVMFGDALGCMRSERSDCGDSGSQFVFGPQLQGVVASGDTIVGPGFEMRIDTWCQCMDLNSTDAIARGYINEADRRILLDWNRRANVYPFLMHLSNLNVTNDRFVSNTAMGNIHICGGYSKDVLPICQTTISEIQDTLVSSKFNTDGTTASIALVSSRVLQEKLHAVRRDSFSVESSINEQNERRTQRDQRSDKLEEPISLDKIEQVRRDKTGNKNQVSSAIVHRALTTIFPVSEPVELVSNVPALASALLYWTTSDLKSVDPALHAQGIETLYAIFLRAGLQRTLPSHGSRCPREIHRDDATLISVSQTGVITVYLIGSIQLALSLLALLLSSVWFISPVPLGPAIRIVTEPVYFIALLSESPFGINLSGTANAQGHVMWQQLDLIARIGESLDTLGEPIGRIRLDRPRMVKNLKNARFYA
ncbi:hypothetical protein CcCBS67573_g06165 [Chytriomyces confervae]|uniref:Uncharacterized protein n=1 Tax=Chytriomyces confervae TaxID=246404 RepID=A0A507F7G4_9FUNG|nr:hypothetical protein CcCBS67573_g06165 [Chytriomyces confervae]